MKIFNSYVFKSKDIITSKPARGFRVKNIYIDDKTGKVVVEYDDTPVGGE